MKKSIQPEQLKPFSKPLSTRAMHELGFVNVAVRKGEKWWGHHRSAVGNLSYTPTANQLFDHVIKNATASGVEKCQHALCDVLGISGRFIELDRRTDPHQH